MTPHNLTPEIERAWSARMSQRIEDCRMSVAGLRMALHLPAGYPTTVTANEVLRGSKNPDQILQILLLVASLQRVEGRTKESLNLIEELFLSSRKQDLVIPFELPFQKALGHFALGAYASALDSFLSAKTIARSKAQALLATANSVFCLDFLSLSFEKTLKEAQSLSEQLSEEEKRDDIVVQFIARLESLKILENFRTGLLDSICEHSVTEVNSYPQNVYIDAWVRALPYHEGHEANLDTMLEVLSLSNPHAFRKPYLIRTLQGLLHPDDSFEFHESEFCDRIYLWTWWWLKDPSRFPIQKVMVTLKNVNLNGISHRLTMDDYQKLRNALHWLGLFDPKTYHRLESIAQSIRPHSGREHELFQFEYLLISYLIAKRDQKEVEAQDYFSILKTHALWASNFLFLPKIARLFDDETSLASTSLEKLAPTLLALTSRNANETEESTLELQVDLSNYLVKHLVSQKEQISEPMCKALDLLHRSNQVPCADFLAVAFGISGYDSLVHDPKIFNLLARLRKIIPQDLRIGVKSGQVFAIGSWRRVSILRPPTESFNLQTQAEWKSFVLAAPRSKLKDLSGATEQWVRPQLLFKKLSGKTEFSREEIEAITGTSRSTANRLISGWIKKGFVKRRGKARCTVYSLTDVLNKGGLNETHL